MGKECLSGVTVVVPTLNRASVLYNCINDLLAQTYRPLEILVIDQSQQKDERLLRLVEEHPKTIRHMVVPFRGLLKARNFGWQNALYPMLLYVDDDIRCGVNLVSRHVESLREDIVGLVAGGIDAPSGEPDLGPPTGYFSKFLCEPVRGFAAKSSGVVDHVPGGNFSAKTHVLGEVGGFDEVLGVGASLYEELELCLRVTNAGYRIVFDSSARLLHLAEGSGGCRVDSINDYIFGLAHNRGVLFYRYLRAWHYPTAVFRLIWLAFAYATRYRDWRVIFSMVSGLFRGVQAGALQVSCGDYRINLP